MPSHKLILTLLLFCLPLSLHAREYVFTAPTEPHFARDLAETMITAAYLRLGHTAQFKRVPLERGLVEANSGSADGDTYRAVQGFSEYPNLIPVKVSVAEDDLVAFGKGVVLKVNGLASLKPWRLVSVRGIKLLQTLGPDYNVHFVTTAEQMFRFLQIDRADIAILTRGAACMPAQLGIVGIKIQDPAIDVVRFYQHLNSKHAELVPQVETVLRQMQKDGSTQRIKDEVRARWSSCANVPTAKQTLSAVIARQ